MTAETPIQATAQAPRPYSGARNEDDKALLRAAVELTRDIVRYQGMLITKARWKTEVLTAEVQDANQNRRARQTGGVKLRSA